MTQMEEDRRRCLEQYLAQARGVNTEGLRDELYQACVRFQAGSPEQDRLANRRIVEAQYVPCPYSGLPAVVLLSRHREALTQAAEGKLFAFLSMSRELWQQTLEKQQYNSFHLLASLSLVGCGRYLRDPEATHRGEAGIVEMAQACRDWDLPEEYLSPFYTAQQLASLSQIQHLPVSDRCRRAAEALEQHIWRGVLRHYQRGLLELIGPYSRGYTSELAGHFQIILACIYRLLGAEAGFCLRDTLWNPRYAGAIVHHGSLEGMQLYALFFSAFPYRCREEDLAAWRSRATPEHFTETIQASGGAAAHVRRQEGLAVAWVDREYGNGMACPGLQILYRAGEWTKSIFCKLVREDRYIGEWNDYPHLGLRLSPCNFPDDGRKTVAQDGEDWIVTFWPREHCRGASTVKLDLIFPTHFSLPDRVEVGTQMVERFDGQERYPLGPVTVYDGGVCFQFMPLDPEGYWKFTLRNRFLNLEWVRPCREIETMQWRLRAGVRT